VVGGGKCSLKKFKIFLRVPHAFPILKKRFFPTFSLKNDIFSPTIVKNGYFCPKIAFSYLWGTGVSPHPYACMNIPVRSSTPS
jgi:hypothetical protein